MGFTSVSRAFGLLKVRNCERLEGGISLLQVSFSGKYLFLDREPPSLQVEDPKSNSDQGGSRTAQR